MAAGRDRRAGCRGEGAYRMQKRSIVRSYPHLKSCRLTMFNIQSKHTPINPTVFCHSVAPTKEELEHASRLRKRGCATSEIGYQAGSVPRPINPRLARFRPSHTIEWHDNAILDVGRRELVPWDTPRLLRRCKIWEYSNIKIIPLGL